MSTANVGHPHWGRQRPDIPTLPGSAGRSAAAQSVPGRGQLLPCRADLVRSPAPPLHSQVRHFALHDSLGLRVRYTCTLLVYR